MKWSKSLWILSAILFTRVHSKNVSFLFRCTIHYIQYTMCQTINFLATRQDAQRDRERYAKVLLVSSKVHCSFIRSNIVQEKKANTEQKFERRKTTVKWFLLFWNFSFSRKILFNFFEKKNFLLQSFCSNFYLIFLFLSLPA